MDAGQRRASKRHHGEMEADKTREHHPSLFFEDGNVILATESWLFCVHKSILKSYSPVFEGLFDLPQPSESQLNTYNKMPMIFMSGDTDEDIIILLRTIYERNFYDKYRKTDINVILGLLRISSKYEITSIRSDVIQQLKSCYPSTLADFDELNHKQPSYSPVLMIGSTGKEILPEDSFRLLELALQTKAKPIMPLLFYSCACTDIDAITIMVATGLLCSTDALKLLVGRHKLIVSFHVGMQALRQTQGLCCSRMISTQLGGSSSWVDIPYGIVELKLLQSRVCSDCRKIMKPKIQKIRQEYWDEIPRAFGLGDWESIQE